MLAILMGLAAGGIGLTAAISAYVKYTLPERVAQNTKSLIINYKLNNTDTRQLDIIQRLFRCCGDTTYQTYSTTPLFSIGNVPDSCCKFGMEEPKCGNPPLDNINKIACNDIVISIIGEAVNNCTIGLSLLATAKLFIWIILMIQWTCNTYD